MTKNRIIIFSLLILALVISNLFELKTEVINFTIGTFLLVNEILTYSKFEQRKRHSKIFSVKSYEWINGLALTVIFILFFSDDEMNIWNIIALVLITTFGILFAIRNRTKIYTYNIDGLTNLNDNKTIRSESITEVNLTSALFSIDTKNFRNELVINSVDIKSPKWENLKPELENIIKTWANNGEHA